MRARAPPGHTSTSWPRCRAPPDRVPVTTVPAPATAKARSTARRAVPSGGAGANACNCAPIARRSASMPVPLSAETGTTGQSANALPATAERISATRGARSGSRSALVRTITPERAPRYSTICRCSSVCGIQPSLAATTSRAMSTAPTPATMFLTKSSWPGTSTIPTSRVRSRSGTGNTACAKPSSMVMPRRFSSGSRSGSVPVRACTSELLPWSM